MPCNSVNSCQHFTPFALHIIPKQYCKKRYCPYCNGSLEKELVYCTYRPDDETEIDNKLSSYRCESCTSENKFASGGSYYKNDRKCTD